MQKKRSLLVAQSGGPTAVINSSLVGVVHAALAAGRLGTVIGARFGIEGVLADDLVDLGRVVPETLEQLRRTPAAALGSGRYKLRPGDVERALETFRRHDVGYFIYIGGNDSADSAHRIARAAAAAGDELVVVGVPKTIDNDLPLTDHCPGYGSIARFVALATRDAGRDTESMRRVDPIKLIEVMGRNAGWVAAAAALGKGEESEAPHLIYLPERPLDPDRFLDDVQRTYDRYGFVVAVVAETLRQADGRPVAQMEMLESVDGFGHPRLIGAAHTLSGLVANGLKLRARWDRPGTIQRMLMATVSEVDLEEGYRCGQAAVAAALAGETDRMVTLVRVADAPYACTTGLAPLAEIANSEKRLPDEYLAPDGTAVTPAFLRYARPLIGGPLPEYGRI
ncbi:MAG: 6-phosphofructokinase [Chloroflexi bacterium]|nr:6-phosphofructokinase [Chloroflexota bacterium]